jgi:hypothetical protein
MSIEVDASRAPRLLRYTLTGRAPSEAEVREVRLAVREAGQLNADTRVLIDARGVDPPATWKELQTHAWVGDSSVRPAAVGVLVRPGAHVGVANQLLNLLPDGLETARFTDEAAALSWWAQPPDRAPGGREEP